jgi:hypothetical protein
MVGLGQPDVVYAALFLLLSTRGVTAASQAASSPYGGRAVDERLCSEELSDAVKIGAGAVGSKS